MIILLCFACSMTLELQAQQPQLEKLSEEAVDQDGIDMAQELTENILDKMAEGSYYEFQEGEAIPMLEQQFTEQMQQQQYQMIQSQLGTYESGLEYQEAYQATQAGQEFTIYRFRAEFSQGQPEVRVVFTPDNQLAGLRVLPWQEQLQ
jgi:hypothetical protein